jgi:hypothetical protein
MRRDHRAIGFRQKRPAACRKHRWLGPQQPRNDLGLACAKESLAVALEYLGDRAIRSAHDFVVRIAKRHGQNTRKRCADRSLASPHHSNHHDRLFQPHNSPDILFYRLFAAVVLRSPDFLP